MIACFDIGGSFIKYGVPGADGLVPELGRVSVPANDYDAFVDALKTAIAAMPAPIDIVSIAIAGFVDPETGRAIIANIPCLNGRVLQPDLDIRLGCRTIVTNDADCFALAESAYGVAQGRTNVFAIILGSGVGGGVVINGRLVNGAGGIAGEWGHSPIVDRMAGGLLSEPLPEIACGCGRKGCLDSYGGARGLERIHRVLTGQAADSTQILGAWKAGNAAADRSVAVYVETVARPLNLIVNTVGIDSVPVGGGLASAPDLIARIDARVRALVLAPRNAPLVVPGMRADDGGLVGAALAGVQALGEAA